MVARSHAEIRFRRIVQETQFELNSTECATNELRVLYMDPFEWVRIADDQGNGYEHNNESRIVFL